MNSPSSPPILQIDNATAYRSQNKVMDGFSASVGDQQHTAIIGPNGSGKSTFIQLMTHQLHPVVPEDGSPVIRLFGKAHWNVAELRERMGIVSADLEYQIVHNLKRGHLSGREVVLSGFFSSMQLFGHHKIDDTMVERAESALASMHAEHLSGRTFARMSAGEVRRVLIARALVTDPDLLILDEPTTSLDFVSRHTCLERVREVCQKGTTLIIVTHHMEEVIPEIRQVILLKEGASLYSGPKEEILTSKALSTVFDHPVNLQKENERYRIEL